MVVSQNTYELASQTLPELLKQGAGAARTLLGEDSERAKKFEQGVDKFGANTAMARSLVEVYRPYIQELVYTFHGTNIRALYKPLTPADARAPSVRARADRLGGLLDQRASAGTAPAYFRPLDLHTRGRARAPRRHRTLIELLDRAAERYGSRPALVARQPSGERTTISYRELRDSAHRAGLLLGMRGVKAGRSRAADRRELARVGARVLLDPLRRRGRGAARPSDFARRAGADLPHRHAPRGALLRTAVAKRLGGALVELNERDRRARIRRTQPSVRARAARRAATPPIARRSPRSFSPPAPPARPRA